MKYIGEKIVEEDKNYIEEDDYYYNGIYDESGYYTNSSLEDLLLFFKELDDDKILAIARGSVQDDYELDIDGGRYYFSQNIRSVGESCRQFHFIIFIY